MRSLHEKAARLDRALAKHLAEPIELRPVLRTGDFEAVIDVDRRGGVFPGHLFLKQERADLGGAGKHWGVDVAIEAAVLKVGEKLLPLGVHIQEGDEIVARDRGMTFKVINVSPPKLGQIEVELGGAG